MAIENTYLLGKNITLGCGFDLQAKAPLDSRMTVATYEGLAALVNGNAAYEGMRVFVETGAEKGNYQYLNGEWKNELAELKTLIENTATAAMEFKGAATALPENPAKGDFYKVTTSFDVAEGETAKIGDSIVYDGEQWFIIPSGDDIEDTWRPVTDVDNDATLTFVAGDKLEKTVAADGTITYKHEEIDAPTATPVGEDEQTRTYIASIETDGHGHITGYKTATENVEDTNTTYEFEGIPVGEDEAAPSNVYFQVTSSEEGATAEVIYIDAYARNEADGKFVEKVDGKQLSTEDFTTALLNKLNGIAEEANKYEHAEHTAYAEGFYKVTVDTEGHVTNAVAVAKEDIVALGIPGQDTTYEKATADADGLMSKEHFAKVEGIAEGATKVENVGGGKIKINDQEVTVYAHPDKHDIADVDGLQGALDGKIESVKVNGEVLEIKDKSVDITVPTGALADKDEVAKADLADALATEIDNKVASVTAGDASIAIGGTATAPTVATKISAAEGNALTLAEDGLKVIIPESTKVEASDINGNIKVDGEEVNVYSHPDNHTASEISDFATEVARVKVDEAVKATQDGNGKIITDTYAEKATTLAGYGICDAYTKEEVNNANVVILAEAQKYVENLLTWGEF